MHSRFLAKAVKEFIFYKDDGIIDIARPVLGKISGNSMGPQLPHGRIVTMVPCSSPIHIGHCYVFLLNGKFLIHRLVYHSKSTAYFIGDKNICMDKVPRSNIIAKLTTKQSLFPLMTTIFINWLFCILIKTKYVSIASMLRKKYFFVLGEY